MLPQIHETCRQRTAEDLGRGGEEESTAVLTVQSEEIGRLRLGATTANGNHVRKIETL